MPIAENNQPSHNFPSSINYHEIRRLWAEAALRGDFDDLGLTQKLAIAIILLGQPMRNNTTVYTVSDGRVRCELDASWNVVVRATNPDGTESNAYRDKNGEAKGNLMAISPREWNDIFKGIGVEVNIIKSVSTKIDASDPLNF